MTKKEIEIDLINAFHIKEGLEAYKEKIKKNPEKYHHTGVDGRKRSYLRAVQYTSSEISDFLKNGGVLKYNPEKWTL